MIKKLLLPFTFLFLLNSFTQAFELKQEPVKPKTEKSKKSKTAKKASPKKSSKAVSLSDDKNKPVSVKPDNEDGLTINSQKPEPEVKSPTELKSKKKSSKK
jgi:hypothetical protein